MYLYVITQKSKSYYMVKINRPDQPLPEMYKNKDTTDDDVDLGEPQCKDIPNFKYGSIISRNMSHLN